MDRDVKDPDEWLTVQEVADELKINPETVRVWIREQQLPARVVGKTPGRHPRAGYRVLRKELAEFLDKRRVN